MRKQTLFPMLLVVALLLTGCTTASPVSPTPHATVPTKMPTAVLPTAIIPTATVQPTATPQPAQTINLYQSLNLANVVSIEVVPGMPGAQHTIIEAQTAQRLARAFDAELSPVGRSQCAPTYKLIFELTGEKRVDLDVIGCDLEHPPVLAGPGVQAPSASVQSNEALQKVLDEIVSPLLPHPVPSPAPGSSDDAQRVPQAVYDALDTALALLRSSELAQSPAPDLSWAIVPDILTGTEGARHYQGQAVDWSAQIIQPAAEPGQESYAIKLFHEPTAFEWTTHIGPDGHEVLPRDPQAPSMPAEDEVPEAVRLALAQAVAYIYTNHPDLAPAPTLPWSITRDTPENLLGATWYRLEADGWEGRLIAPVVAPDAVVYDVTLAQTDGEAHWALRVDGQGNVTEMPRAAAGATKNMAAVSKSLVLGHMSSVG